MRAGRWPVASLRVPYGGVDGCAGGVRNVQVGQQRAHVQGIGVPNEDLTEDRGVGGKQYALPGGGGGEEWASQERWCRVTCASTMACEVWQGRTW